MSEFISSNPYRILGISSESGQREIQKNLSKMKAYAKLGRKVVLDYDLPQLPFQEPIRDEDTVSKIESKILLDLNKVKYSLFWYQNCTPYDSVALEHLKNGDIDKSLEIFQKAAKSDKITSKNISAHNNLSTLLLHKVLDSSRTDVFKKDADSIAKISEVIGNKIEIIDSEYFENFCESINVTSDIDRPSVREAVSKVFLKRLVKNYSRQDLRQIIANLDEHISEAFSNELVKAPVANIKTQLKSTSDKLTENSKEGILLGKSLIKNCVADLKELEGILGKSHYLYEELADKISNQIMQCGIVYFNDVGEDQDFLSAYKYALSIATSEKTKSRAKDCIKHCEEEALNNLCCICSINKTDNSRKKTVTMYKVTERNHWTNQIKYQRLNLEISFCRGCNDQLNSKTDKNLLIKGVITVIIAIVVAAMAEEAAMFLFGLLSFLIVSPLVDGINSEETDSIRKHPKVREAFRQGFSFQEPS